jgi:hypothetical protein
MADRKLQVALEKGRIHTTAVITLERAMCDLPSMLHTIATIKHDIGMLHVILVRALCVVKTC